MGPIRIGEVHILLDAKTMHGMYLLPLLLDDASRVTHAQLMWSDWQESCSCIWRILRGILKLRGTSQSAVCSNFWHGL